MKLQTAFGQTLKRHRKAKELSQEAFSEVSSRTYLSELERGLKNPSLDKIDELARTMGIHPLTLLTDCFSCKDGVAVEDIFATITRELESLRES
ncbi:MAG: transcriptional regulator [Alteromonadaceae bacterium]|nr:transcriptional regulator [Alteromonadaceae bacterium]|tara:strand:+ start:4870 stop:5151 length:282 start_codon:yes stop_codon:yes gene_type:complete